MLRILTVTAAVLIGTPGHALDRAAAEAIIADPRGLGAPGCAVGAFRDGVPLFITASGAGDIARGTPLDGDTLFYAASISKQFTALAAALLAESGRLDLDADIRRYLPESPDYGRPVTSRMLMTHTAGVRDTLDLIRMAGLGRAADVNKDTALRLVLAQQSTNFPPGTDYTYSNGGYLLLAEVVARASGMPFADYARQAILEPLGMTRSVLLVDRAASGPNIAHGYALTRRGFEVRDTYPQFSGSGGLMISMNDLARFEHDIAVGHRVWTPAIERLMTTPGRLDNGATARDDRNGLAYAGGLMIGDRRDRSVIQHGGSAEAFKNFYARLPEQRLSLALFCNRDDWVAQDKADAILDAIATETDSSAQPAPAFEGRYGSPEVGASYTLTTTGDGLDAVVGRDGAADASRRLQFKRDEDGGYRAGGTRLTFDHDGGAFTLSTARVTALRFHRLD